MSDLLDLDDIAERWKVKRDYAKRYLVKRPEFPDQAPGSTRKNQRWLARDIDAFLAGSKNEAGQCPQ
jgi:hypothetical protein